MDIRDKINQSKYIVLTTNSITTTTENSLSKVIIFFQVLKIEYLINRTSSDNLKVEGGI